MLLFLIGACCCCCSSSQLPAEPVPEAYLDYVGRWVCEDGNAWQFREDGTYTHRGKRFEERVGRITGYAQDRLELDGQSVFGMAFVDGGVSLQPLTGCVALNGSACLKVGLLPPPPMVGMWQSRRPDGLETLAPGIFLQRLKPGEGPRVAEDDEIWFDARTSRQRHATAAGRVSELPIPQWRIVAQHLSPREVARVFLDETRPELHGETVFDVGISHRFPPEPGPFWQRVDASTDEAPTVERFAGTRATEPQTDTYGRFVRYEAGTRRPTLVDTFLPRSLGERAPFTDHLQELTPGSRVRIRTERVVYDVIVDGRGEPPRSEPLALGDWQEERQQLFVREDGYAEIWEGLQSYGGLFSAGAHARVKFCDKPDLDSVFEISDDVLTWEGGELVLDATFDADVLEAAKLPSTRPASGSSGRRSRGGSDFDLDFD